uniref:Uncharacterized protein n=1 Tax=Lutzomyia longipalpis TaxID=7200 RepID=A0A1B0CWE6_LUTLO
MSELTPEEIRQRRLRRLGMGEPTRDAQESGARGTSVSSSTESGNSREKISACGEERQSSLELVEHRQKQQKIDTELNNEVVLTTVDQHSVNNNYRGNLGDEGKTPTASSTTDNQVVVEEHQRMETDECLEGDKLGDCDSGIENMETEDCSESAKAIAPNAEILLDNRGNTQLEMEIYLSKVLNATWAEHCKGAIIVKEVATEYMDSFEEVPDVEDLTSRVLVNVIQYYMEGFLRKSSADFAVNVAPSGDGKPPMEAFERRMGALDYLVRCYDVIRGECYNLTASKRINTPELMAFLDMVKVQILQHAVLVLNGTIRSVKDPAERGKIPERSPLLQLMLEKTIDGDFLQNFIAHTYKNVDVFREMFEPVLRDSLPGHAEGNCVVRI